MKCLLFGAIIQIFSENRKEQEMSRMLILSPLDGRVIPLEEVPDEVFAEKLLGDGAAAGQLLCTADMDFLKSKGINTVTPVLVTDGAEEGSFSVKTGEIRHGEEIMTAEISVDAAAAADGDAQKPEPSAAQTAGRADAAAPSAKKKLPIDFDFLQKLGKSLMTVIAVMPAAGLMISLGNILMMFFPAGFGLMAGNTMAQIGWAIIGNLHILSCSTEELEGRTLQAMARQTVLVFQKLNLPNFTTGRLIIAICLFSFLAGNEAIQVCHIREFLIARTNYNGIINNHIMRFIIQIEGTFVAFEIPWHIFAGLQHPASDLIVLNCTLCVRDRHTRRNLINLY